MDYHPAGHLPSMAGDADWSWSLTPAAAALTSDALSPPGARAQGCSSARRSTQAPSRYSSIVLTTSPTFNRVRSRWPHLTCPASRTTFPVSASIVIL